MSVLVVGPIGLDELHWPSGTRRGLLGGAVPAFALAARHFDTVRIVSVAGDDFPAEHLAVLRQAGIDTSALQVVPGPTFRWGARYHEDLNTRDTLYTELGVFAEFTPEVPVSHRTNEVAHITAAHPALQERSLRQVRPTTRVCTLDTMDPWLDEARPDLERALALVDIALMAEDEALRFTHERTPRAAAGHLSERNGVHFLVVKLGSHGALLFGPEGRMFAVPAWPLAAVRDPTGAGDAFAGGFLGHLGSQLAGGAELTWAMLCHAAVWGATLGSFACEGAGVERLLTLTGDDLATRHAALLALPNPDHETIATGGDS